MDPVRFYVWAETLMKPPSKAPEHAALVTTTEDI
jgi:hypothetical protein